MPCYHPIPAWRLANGEVVFVERGDVVQSLELPCGRCVGCRLERSRKWAARIMQEVELHDSSVFVTLTYDDAHLPERGSLRYRDFQLFMKRLRKVKGKVRFYMCGEYGDTTDRPHYHAILFGVDFDDKEVHSKNAQGDVLHTSALLSRLWPYGFSLIGNVSFESAGYVARYIMKKVTGDLADDHYRRVDAETGEVFYLEPEFNRMSLKPGIAGGWFEKFREDVFPHDYVVMNGVRCKPPRFFDERLKKSDPEGFEDVKYRREVHGRKSFENNTAERLKVRERVALAKLSKLKRGLQ